MKKTLLAAALAATLSPAFAQSSVTMYGIVDAGVSIDRTGVPGENTAARVNSGYLSTSRLGFSGSEDLGAGLKGVFTLELGFAADTGAFSSTATGSAGFNRRAFVGVEGGFGTITLGRDYTPVFHALLATDTLGLGLYGSLNSAAELVGGNVNQYWRADNAVFYTSPSFSGLTVRAMASAGGENFGNVAASGTTAATAKAEGRMYALGGDYVSGPLTVAAAYQTRAISNAVGNDTDDRKDAVVGAKYNFGAFSLGGGYAQSDLPGDSNTRKLAWVGGTVKLGAGTVLAQFSQHRLEVAGANDQRANTFALGYTYPLSRRTTAYASYGQVANSNGAAVGLYASDPSVGTTANHDPRGFAVGVRHAF